jgi:hypothetical protein
VNQLSKKWGLQVAVNDGTDVVFYDNHGKVNGTQTYNDFNDALDATYDLARMYKMSYGTNLQRTFTKKKKTSLSCIASQACQGSRYLLPSLF